MTNDELLINGIPARGTILGLRSVPHEDDDTLVEFELALDYAGRRIDVAHCQPVSALAVRNLRLGSRINVLVDATNPSRLIIA